MHNFMQVSALQHFNGTKLGDVHHNQCFEKRILSDPWVYQSYLKQVNVETGKTMRNTLSDVQEIKM